MKGILMSIKPKWVKKIASGEKTVEVRKTVPKCGTPFKCYIYVTKDRKNPLPIEHGKVLEKVNFWENTDAYYGFGKVVGEFVCDRIECLKAPDLPWSDPNGERERRICNESCLTFDQIAEYGKGSNLWGWHISDLKMFEEPKEIKEFHKPCGMNRPILCYICRHYSIDFHRCTNYINTPQSWCYVEAEV